MTTAIVNRSGWSPYEVELESAIFESEYEDQIMAFDSSGQVPLESDPVPGNPDLWGLDLDLVFPFIDAREAFPVGVYVDRIIPVPPIWDEPEGTVSEHENDHLGETRRRLDRANRHFPQKGWGGFQ